ncbi:MAG TPA: glutamate 5-kinase [Natronincola sp.]|nr:glutamate 5-kinase [Natronincola sp.]
MITLVSSRQNLKETNRIVVKVGTSSLTYDSGRLNLKCLDLLVREIANLHNAGKEVLLVSSGAVGAGIGRLGLKERPNTIPERQAVAAVGQGLLMQMYTKLFAEYGINTAQILLTREDMSDRKRYLNVRNTLTMLANKYRVLPIINENDTVATDELLLRFGDNDTLAALVASSVGADLLILLSDIEGLYSSDPRENKDAYLISEVKEITPEIMATAGKPGTARGTGGMQTKLEAARIATSAGICMVLASGDEPHILSQIIDGEAIGTIFIPRPEALAQRERWIAFGGQPLGAVIIDQGAVTALVEYKKSLLPSGIIDVIGDFGVGDLVWILDAEKNRIARGLSNFSSEEISKIKGHNTAQLPQIVGHKTFDEVVHRNNMVCLDGSG